MRPTKYKPEYCEMIVDFFDVSNFVYDSGEGLKLISSSLRFPSFNSFAKSINVDRHTLENWTKSNADFLDAYTMARYTQEETINILVMHGLIDKNIAIFWSKAYLKITDTDDSFKAREFEKLTRTRWRLEKEVENSDFNNMSDEQKLKEIERINEQIKSMS